MFFKKLSAAEASESIYMRERVKFYKPINPFPTYTKSAADGFENIFGKIKKYSINLSISS